MKTLQEEAEELVRSEFCGACKGSEVGCDDYDICDGYKEELEQVIKDLEREI